MLKSKNRLSSIVYYQASIIKHQIIKLPNHQFPLPLLLTTVSLLLLSTFRRIVMRPLQYIFAFINYKINKLTNRQFSLPLSLCLRAFVPTLLCLSMLLALGSWLLAPNAYSVSGFTIKFPSIPYPPLIKSVTGPSSGVAGSDTTTIIAQIVGQDIMTGRCKDGSSSCDSSLIEQIKDTTVSPNPPEIKAAWINWSKLDTSSKPTTYPFTQVAMTYNSTTSKWEGKISIPSSGYVKGDKIMYFITAVDSRGNVATEIPATTVAQSVPNKWEDKYASLAPLDNCKYATSYDECSVNKSGTPTCAGTTYTLNDRTGDTCGPTDSNGNQSPASNPKTDVLGISAAMDGTFAYVKMGLGDQSNNPPEIEGFIVVIFNPDIADSNPVDSYITNAFGASYAPEAITVGNGLDIALWSVKCLTTPGKSTEEVLNCRLISGAKSGKLEVGMGTGNNLYYKIKKSGTGELVAESYSFMGSSKVMYLMGGTGEIVVTPTSNFWLSDLSGGLAFYYRNKTLTIGDPPPTPPTSCKISCNGGAESSSLGSTVTCTASSEQTYDECKMAFSDSTTTGVTQYKVYRSANEDCSSPGTAKYSVNKGTSPYSQIDKITDLGGVTYCYYITSKSSTAENPAEDSLDLTSGCFGYCKVRNNKVVAPTLTMPTTPVGEEKSCKLIWTYSKDNAAPTSFKIYKGSSTTPLTTITYDSSTETFSFTDTGLTILTAYEYKAESYKSSTDKQSTEKMSCTAEDRKAPASPAGLTAASAANYTVKLSWTANSESDIREYKIYKCEKGTKTCQSENDFKDGYVGAITAPAAATDTKFTSADDKKEFCFYVEAFDNCYDSNPRTCPSNTKANSSGFPKDTTTGIKCASVCESGTCTTTTDTTAPPTPTMSDIGNTDKCTVSWSSVTDESSPVSYNIYRCDDSSQCSACAGATPSQCTAFTKKNSSAISAVTSKDTPTPTETKTYNYAVTAVDAKGNESKLPAVFKQCAIEVATTTVCTTKTDAPASITDIPATNTCSITWASVMGLGVKYNVYRCTGDTSTCTACTEDDVSKCTKFSKIDAAAKTTSLTYKDTKTRPSELDTTKYTYCVTAIDETATFCESRFPSACKVCTPEVITTPTCTGDVQVKGTLQKTTIDKGVFTPSGADGIKIELMKLNDANKPTDGTAIPTTITTGSDGSFNLCLKSSDLGAGYTGNYYSLFAIMEPTKKYPCTILSGSDCKVLVAKAIQAFKSCTSPTEANPCIFNASPSKLAFGPAAGDANCDGKVNAIDFMPFKNAFGATSKTDSKYNAAADFNGDGKVNAIDFMTFKNNFSGNNSTNPPCADSSTNKCNCLLK